MLFHLNEWWYSYPSPVDQYILIKETGSFPPALSDSFCLCNCLPMKEVFILCSLPLATWARLRLMRRWAVNPLNSLKPVPNANLFNSVLLWPLASAFGLQEHFGPSYTVVSVVFTGGDWFSGILPMLESCMAHNFHLDPVSLVCSIWRNRRKCDNSSSY